MISQIKFKIAPRRRGCHLITREILNNLPSLLPKVGLLNIFDVRHDMEMILDDLVKENQPYYFHTLEGNDDMPAHAKCSLLGSDLTIPIRDGQLALGLWQGIYLCEFRDYGGERSIVATIFE